MAFAPVEFDLSYWQKQTKPLFPDLAWNIPEQKTGHLTIIGGHSQGFNAVIRLAEYLEHHFPLRQIDLLLPSSLRSQLPPLANLEFAAATTSGSFDKSPELNRAFDSDFTILAGDLSKNSATAIALSAAIKRTLDAATTPAAASSQTTASPQTAPSPLLITRDAVDLLAAEGELLLSHPQLFLVASLAQLQKLFRAVYYPKMIMLSQPLVPIIETLHKFTLSYPATILTFHADQILVAHAGRITSTPIANTTYSPISLWSGPLAAKIAALNLYNPGHPLEATTAAILFE